MAFDLKPPAAYGLGFMQRFVSAIRDSFAKTFTKNENVELPATAHFIHRTSTGVRKRFVVRDDNSVVCEDVP